MALLTCLFEVFHNYWATMMTRPPGFHWLSSLHLHRKRMRTSKNVETRFSNEICSITREITRRYTKKMTKLSQWWWYVMIVVVVISNGFISGNWWWLHTESVLNQGTRFEASNIFKQSLDPSRPAQAFPPFRRTCGCVWIISLWYLVSFQFHSNPKKCSQYAGRNHWWSPSGQKPWVHWVQHKRGWCHSPHRDPWVIFSCNRFWTPDSSWLLGFP